MISNIFMKHKQLSNKNQLNAYHNEKQSGLKQKSMQKSILSFCQTKNSMLQLKSLAKNQSKTQTNVNDQNQSYLSNRIDKQNNCHAPNILSFSNCEKTQKLGICQNQVINLKKKIKKCIPTYINHRQKIRLIEKNYKKIIDSKQDQYIVQQKNIQFTVFKDTQVFQNQKNNVLRNIIVTQRIDNDTQTDDQQLEKFCNKVKMTFVTEMERYHQQQNSDSSSFELFR